MLISSRLSRVSASATLALNEKVRSLRASGIDIIAFSNGESSLSPPQEARRAAHDAVDSLRFYTAVEGTQELRAAISDYLWRHHALSYALNQIIVSTGCKQSLFNALYTLLNEGDEVIITAPYWTSYPEMVLACGGQPVIAATHQQTRFLPTADTLRPYITSKTKVLILNSPSNPTSQILQKKDLESLAELLIHYPDIIICCDDIYDRLYLSEQQPDHLLAVCPELKERAIVVNGLSKSHAMSGWRLGFAAGPQKLIKAMVTLQSQSTSNACVITQAAAVAALRDCDKDLVLAREFYQKQHSVFSAQLSALALPIVEIPPQGGFYRWLDLRGLLAKGAWKNDSDFAQDLLMDQHVSIVPGSAFGQEGFFRFSVTETAERLVDGLKRLQQFLVRRHLIAQQ
jgi:aspartate aminotransferase